MVCPKFGTPIEQFQIGPVVRKTHFSTSYKAVDRADNSAVTIEVANRISFDSPQKIKEYYQRARRTGSLEHPNIHLPSQFSVTEGNSPFFIWMPPPAHDLWHRLEHSGNLGAQEVATIFVRMCEVLIYARSNGVVRTAIYPGDLLIGDDQGSAFLTGFERELVQSCASTGEYAVHIETVYKAPESCLSISLSIKDCERTDVYILGCLMAEACSGRPLELPDSFTKFVSGHDFQKSVRWLSSQPESDALDKSKPIHRIICKCIELNPMHRYLDLSGLRDELLSVL